MRHVAEPDRADLDARLARALAPWLGDGEGVLLAVSGGPDSTALLHAAARGRAAGARLFVATVDHGLRPEAAAEARAVARLAGGLGLPHATLAWGGGLGGGLQAAAREGRYRLLAGHAAALGARRVLTAHTADDQAETVLMRLLAGSGPAGLAGMRRARPLQDGVTLARPFLDLTKAELVAYCAAHGLAFASDPSNADPRFARTRLRGLLPLLAAEGLSAERLRRLAARLARDEAALGQAAAALLVAANRPDPRGGLTLDGARLLAVPEAVALRTLDRALDAVAQETAQEAGARAPRRLERLERLVLDALLPALARREPLRRTLRGVLVSAGADACVRLAPAPLRRAPRGSRVAGATDLLGKAGGAAYIGPECPE